MKILKNIIKNSCNICVYISWIALLANYGTYIKLFMIHELWPGDIVCVYFVIILIYMRLWYLENNSHDGHHFFLKFGYTDKKRLNEF